MARWKLIAGIIIALFALPFLLGGLAMTIALPLIEDNEGYYTSSWSRISDNVGSGFVFNVDIETGGPDSRFDLSDFANFKFRAKSDRELFVGIAEVEEVDAFLSNASYHTLTHFDFGWDPDGEEETTYESQFHLAENVVRGLEPTWDVSQRGTAFTIYWPPKEGNWSVVVLNADYDDINPSMGYEIQYKVGVKAPILRAIGLGLLAFGAILFIIAGLLIYFDIKQHRVKPTPVWATKEFTREPPPIEAVPGKVFCNNCGTQAEQNDVFCTVCGDRLDLFETRFRSEAPYEEPHPDSDQLIVANFGTRFWAWLIDIVLIFSIIEGLRWVAYIGTGSQSWFPTGFDIFSFGPGPILLFAYWFVCSWQWGQSLGQKALGLELVDQTTGALLKDNPGKVALSVFGKAFLLPIDMIIGWILGGQWEREAGVNLKQRLFQRLAGTTVVRKRKTDIKPASEIFAPDR